jgi:hypothetical protein
VEHRRTYYKDDRLKLIKQKKGYTWSRGFLELMSWRSG